MGLCASKEEVVEVVPPAGPSDDELRTHASTVPLPKAHDELAELINLAEDPGKINAWLKLINETRVRRKKLEEDCGGMEFAQFREWASAVGSCVAKGILTISALEEAWQVASDETKEKRKIVADGEKLPLPPDDKELGELVELLLERDTAKTHAHLKLIDETRMRRKKVEAASQFAFADLRAQVAVVEVCLDKGVLLDEYLHKAWQPLPRGHVELTHLIESLVQAHGEAGPAVDGGSADADAEAAPAPAPIPTSAAVEDFLRVVEQTKERKAAVESMAATAGIAWDPWVRAIDGCVASGVIAPSALERVWNPAGGTDAAAKGAATQAATRSGADDELYTRATKPPGELMGHSWEGHVELEELLDVLQERDPAKTAAWLTLIDETRMRRKAIEKAAGVPYSEFREWAEAVEEAFTKHVISKGPLEKAWRLGKHAERI